MALTRLDREGNIGIITMTNTARRNTLSEAMIDEFLKRLDLCKEVRARAIILRAEPGVKVWSAGHDVSELPVTRRDPLGWSDHLRVVIRAIEKYPAPVIALIEGSVWGGACELAMSCDMVIAAPESTFALTPARLGIPYNISGLLTFMNAMNLHLVKEMVFTASPVPATRAAQLGIVNHIVPANEISQYCMGLAHEIEKLAPLSIAVMKEELRLLASAHSITPLMFERIQGLRRKVYDSRDYQEGVQAFKEKRPPSFIGE